MAGDPAPILEPGVTCWRLARAERFALIVDAAPYFAALKEAMIAARRSILLIGWDFDTRVRLDPESADAEWPSGLGAFISALVKRRPELQIHVLKWDLGLLLTLGRGAMPLFVLDWMTSRRVHLRLDRSHPLGACHHQKIAVIDDAIAFCGGIDITVGRWDTSEHRDEDPRRTSPWGFEQPPWHDATAAVDGEAARALGELARARWKHATGEDIPAPPRIEGHWPASLDPTFSDIDVGIARTQPESRGEPEVREVEALTLRAIASARQAIYIESQYLAADAVGRALAARLAEADGPDIVIVNPESTEGWLEEEAMGSARALILRRLAEADRHGRLRAFHPVTSGGEPIYVHAKIFIVDDRFLRVGSSNLNNRSMGLDTECDLAIEAGENEVVRAGIRAFRDRLIAEHLGRQRSEVAARTGASGLVEAIDGLRAEEGRTLRPLEPAEVNDAEKALVEEQLLDPDRPEPLRRTLSRLKRRLGR